VIVTATIVAALLGGGALLRKRFGKSSASQNGNGGGLTSTAIDEFLERRSDGLVQYNKTIGKQIMGWLASVTLAPLPEGPGSARAFQLISSNDGSPPPANAAAGRALVDLALGGSVVLAHRGLTYTGKERRAVAVAPGSRELMELAGEKGAYAVLIVPNEEAIAPTAPPLPGFSPEKKPVPGAAQNSVGAVESTKRMPPSLAAKVDDLLKKPDASSESLLEISNQLRLGGYEAEALEVDKRAADLRAHAIASVARTPATFVIPPGHPGALALAKKLAGNEKRYRDLLAANPALSEKRPGYVVPWTVGQVVRIPASWIRRRT